MTTATEWTVKVFDNNGNLVACEKYATEAEAEAAAEGRTTSPVSYGGQVLVLDPSGNICC